MTAHACTGAECLACLDELLLRTVFEADPEKREAQAAEDPKEVAMGAALEAAARGLAILAAADVEIGMAQATGRDYFDRYVNDPTRGWRT